MTTTFPIPVEAEYTLPRPVRYMFAGALAGMLAAFVATFALALTDAYASGMSAGSCVVYGCVLTLLLSQAAGISGMIAGGGLGALAGGVVSLACAPDEAAHR